MMKSTMDTKKQSLMQQALGKQWGKLPPALKAHYDNNDEGVNIAMGELTIDYPWFMQFPLSVLRLMGALVNQRGEHLPTTVERIMEGDQQYWHRTISFPKNKQIHFKSRFSFDPERNVFTEYTSPMLGLKMKVHVEENENDTCLHYESCGYMLEILALRLPIPECFALGHASIVESASDATNENNKNFIIDFRLRHPLFGEIFSYKGMFATQHERDE